MKIAIVSDTHLGYDRFAEDAYDQAKKAFEMAMPLADVIIIPGDLFDFRFPKPPVIAEGINIMRDLHDKDWTYRIESFNGPAPIYTDLPILAIPGTHERTSVGKENPLNLLSLAGIIADISEGTAIIGKGDDKIAVYGLGGISEERVKEKLKELDPKPVPGMFNIFVFHQSIYEFLPFSDEFLRLDDLPEGFDLYIDGHIHNKIESECHGKPFLIPGSTVLTQLKESEQGSKGFLLYDTDDNTYKFIPIDSRPFRMETLKFNNSKPDEIYKKVDSTLSDIINEFKSINPEVKPIVRIVLEGKLESGITISSLDIRSLNSKYSDDAIVEIESKLSSTELNKEIEDIREGKLNDMSIRDVGLDLLKKNSKKLNIRIDTSKLFNLLSEPHPQSKKKDLTEEVMDFMEDEMKSASKIDGAAENESDNESDNEDLEEIESNDKLSDESSDTEELNGYAKDVNENKIPTNSNGETKSNDDENNTGEDTHSSKSNGNHTQSKLF